MSNIVEMFYRQGGYISDSSFEGQPGYIAIYLVTGTYIPMALERLNSLCFLNRSIDYTSFSSGNSLDDLIITELALSIADSEYDKLHIDPDTGQVENRHWMTAYRYMLDAYGVTVREGFGRLRTVLPREAAIGGDLSLNTAMKDLEIATLSQ